MGSLNLRMKFIIGLVLFALFLGVTLTTIMYFHFNSIMETEISRRSRMLLAQANAVQDYVKKDLRPEMFSMLPEDRFVLKAMSSSYISKQVMDRLSITDASDYHYRRVAINPRNPLSKATKLEAGLIEKFNNNKTLEYWEDNSIVNGDEYHLIARPVLFSEKCMHCHGDPENAPRELIEIYGAKGGFQYTPGEVGGVVVAGFPVSMIKNPAKEVTLQYLVLYLLGIFFFAGLISLFFDRLVIKNLHNLSTVFSTHFSGDKEKNIIEKLRKKDEIEGLIDGVDELALYLSDAKSQLEDYALNLEKMVDKRTLEIKTQSQKHQSDVKLFVGFLFELANSEDSAGFIKRILKRVAVQYGANQVIYFCKVASDNHYALNEKGSVPALDPQTLEIMWKEDVVIRDNCLFIPVKSPESHWGILFISWANNIVSKDFQKPVLLALGLQIGTAIENIQATSNLKFQHDMLQTIFDGISDPLLLIDSKYKIHVANKGAKNLFQHDTHAGQEKKLVHLLENNPEFTMLKEKVQKAGPPSSFELKTDDARYFKINLYPLRQRSEQPGRLVLYAKEITLEKEIMTRMQQAERLSATGKMAAGIAHEINNPLGVIHCYADLVKDAAISDEVKKDIDVILKQTKNVKKVVQDLLNLSRPKQVLSGKCSINHVIKEAVKVFKTQAVSKNIQVTTRLTKNLPDIMCARPVFEQILTNLWLNSFDALREKGGKVLISTSALAKSGEVVLRIKDNGSGISKEVIEKIFDPFFTTKDVGRGTGLGLAVVFGFISELGGKIEVTSDAETVFTVFFPATLDKTLDPNRGDSL